jgi:dTDP-4-dehydrorhamnose reductase
MTVLLFGSTGMLGSYILNYFRENLDVHCINCNAEIDTFEELKSNLKPRSNKGDIVINCIGLIPQSVSNCTSEKYLKINSIFPKYLDIICTQLNLKLIHITTDCVFDGQNGNYTESSIKNETGIYGISKSLGENLQNACIIRTSIIGETSGNRINNSLLEWLKSNKNKTVNGYTNHIWNGITCLQLAKFIYNIIITNSLWNGIRHIHSPTPISKYDLICILNEIYNLNIIIMPIKTNKTINRTLASIHIVTIPELSLQIKEMYNFRQKL